MNCLVCHQEITIQRFHDFLSITPLKLCCRCKSNFIFKKDAVLFENNEWLQGVITRLEKGDVILIDLFFPALERRIKKQLKKGNQVTILEIDSQAPYPWFFILIEQVKQRLPLPVDILIVSKELSNDQTIRLY